LGKRPSTKTRTGCATFRAPKEFSSGLTRISGCRRPDDNSAAVRAVWGGVQPAVGWDLRILRSHVVRPAPAWMVRRAASDTGNGQGRLCRLPRGPAASEASAGRRRVRVA
jgi:hypothetical protein